MSHFLAEYVSTWSTPEWSFVMEKVYRPVKPCHKHEVAGISINNWQERCPFSVALLPFVLLRLTLIAEALMGNVTFHSWLQRCYSAGFVCTCRRDCSLAMQRESWWRIYNGWHDKDLVIMVWTSFTFPRIPLMKRTWLGLLLACRPIWLVRGPQKYVGLPIDTYKHVYIL